MSTYNFNNNHNHHTTASSNHLGNSANNGLQTGYNHVDNDFLNRNFSSTTHSEMSVQLTRPTSKTALLVRQRRAMLESLSCFICKGYLIDATTIDECMDSFCKSCIVNHLRSNNNCPRCGTLIHKTNPLSAIRSDKVLQDIVYKLIPGLYDDEMRRRRDFYRGLYGVSSSEEDDEDSSGSYSEGYPNLSGEKYGVVTHPKPFYKPSDNIDLSIEPRTRGDSSTIYYDNKRQSIVTCFTGNLQQRESHGGGLIFSSVDIQHFKTYLRCPAKLTIFQLKKFIAAKFNTCRDDTIHLLYLNESLKDEYSLIDVAYIYDWRGIEHMRLFYIIERDLSKMSTSDEIQNDGQSRSAKVTRQSVGISTQTVKRVCIDPQPKFYEVKNGSTIGTGTQGRSMRSRVDTTSTSLSSRSAPSQVKQTPTVEFYSSRECANLSESKNVGVSNRVLNREVASLDCQRSSQQSSNRSTLMNTFDDFESRMKKTETKETRSLRSQHTTDSNSGYIPKINISLSALNQTMNQGSKNNEFFDKAKQVKSDLNRNNVVAIPQSNITQLVPYAGKGYTTGLAGTTQSSLVTLASFTEARSNHVMATMSSAATTAATISDSYKNMLDVSSFKPQETTKNNSQQALKSQPSPQLAFSFVTERGITIVRRLNNQNESSGTSTSTSSVVSRSNNIPALPGPQRTSSPSGQIRNVASQYSSSVVGPSSTVSPSGSTSTSSHRTGGEGASARHHVKVKPVYKTFVDPTKLKSPNFKKLGFTARH